MIFLASVCPVQLVVFFLEDRSWCDIFCKHLTECGFFWIKKYHNSIVWTGVSRLRIFIIFLDASLGGEAALDWISATWDFMESQISEEERVTNHAVVQAIGSKHYFGNISSKDMRKYKSKAENTTIVNSGGLLKIISTPNSDGPSEIG